MNENIRSSTDQISTSLSIEALQEIVRNCQRNEQCLHELERHTRHERKKVERLLHETYQAKQERDKQITTSLHDNPKSKSQKSIEFFVSLDNDNIKNRIDYSRRQNNKCQIQDRIDSKTRLKERQKKSALSQAVHSNRSTIDNTHRVRFNIPENNDDIQTNHSNQQKIPTNRDDDLTELSRRCEDLLSCLHTKKTQTTMLENNNYHHHPPQQTSYNPSTTLQQALELLRPEFISHSRQRLQHINFLREDRERQQTLPFSYSNPIKTHHHVQLPLAYQEMKQATKKKYEQLPEVNDRLRQNLISEIQRRNNIRAKIFRIRLRQHVLLHGRTNIDESLTMIDT